MKSLNKYVQEGLRLIIDDHSEKCFIKNDIKKNKFII